MGPLEAEKAWSVDGVKGAKRFLDRVWRMFEFDITDEDVEELNPIFHQTIKKVTDDYEKLAFNTAISQMMIFVNEVYRVKRISKRQARDFLKLLNPIAPHMTEELNEVALKQNEQLIYSDFPTYNEKYLESSDVTVAVSVNGKLRATITVAKDLSNKELEMLALEQENVRKFTDGLQIVKVIVVPNKIVNIVVK